MTLTLFEDRPLSLCSSVPLHLGFPLGPDSGHASLNITEIMTYFPHYILLNVMQV